jgi:uncharacterized lipoprotein YddW (UPF0748 family)
MPKIISFLFIYIGISISVIANETRAVWLTTIGGIDWPHSYSSIEQKAELTHILDDLAAAGINTILLQTRIRALLSSFPAWSPSTAVLQVIPAGLPAMMPYSLPLTSVTNVA